jgi:uncharacterized lipoprotein
MNKILLLIVISTLTGCMTIDGMNADLSKIDQAWEIDNQAAIAQRSHVVNADYNTTFRAVEKTLLDLNMSIAKSSTEKGFITSKNAAPTPLTREQWQLVQEVENPRMQRVAGWMYVLEDDPKDQFVNAKISIKSAGNQSTVNVDYYINAPKYDDMGLITPKNVPPLAEKLACEAFWNQLSKNLPATK